MIKLGNLVEEILSELRGVNFELTLWTNTILNEIKKNGKVGETIIINGSEDTEAHEMFPVDSFFIDIIDENHATYNELKSGLSNGKYYVFLSFSKYATRDIIEHELRHAFEDYKMKTKGKKGFGFDKESQLFYSGDFENFMLNKIPGDFSNFKNILMGLYVTSKTENSAYSQQVYRGDTSAIDYLKMILKNDYSSKSVRDDNRALKQFENLKQNVSIPIFKKFDNYISFMDWADKYIKQRAQKSLNKLLKVKHFVLTDK